MDVREAVVRSLTEHIDKKRDFNPIVDKYSQLVNVKAEYVSILSGIVKNILTVDFYIDKISSKKLKNLSYFVRNTLRLGVYEIAYTQTPNYASINSCVELIKTLDKSAFGFVNAVLRNFSRKKEQLEPESMPIKYSHPDWLIDKWIKQYGEADTIKICEFNNKHSDLIIRVNTLKISISELQKLFSENNIDFSQTLLEECLKVNYFGNVENIIGFKEGLWTVQGIPSSLSARVLNAKEGDKILDVCAAPGGKTTHIAALTNDMAEITALELKEKRIKKIEQNCERLGIKSIKTLCADATTFSAEEKFDCILIDAPCSNTGVLAKRPDARWNRTPKDIKDLAELQFKILKNISSLMKDGGTLVYSTCSLEREENEDVIEKFLAENKEFKLDKIQPFIPWEMVEDKGFIQITPAKHNVEGFFIAKLVKNHTV